MALVEDLYNKLTEGGYYTKSLSEFEAQLEDPIYRKKVHGVVTRDGIEDTDFETFDVKYTPLKKKEESALPSMESETSGSLATQEMAMPEPMASSSTESNPLVNENVDVNQYTEIAPSNPVNIKINEEETGLFKKKKKKKNKDDESSLTSEEKRKGEILLKDHLETYQKWQDQRNKELLLTGDYTPMSVKTDYTTGRKELPAVEISAGPEKKKKFRDKYEEFYYKYLYPIGKSAGFREYIQNIKENSDNPDYKDFIKYAVEEDDIYKDARNAINYEVFRLWEGDAASLLSSKLGQYGYTFDQAVAGEDWIKVTSPGKQTIQVKANVVGGGEQSRKLLDFIYDTWRTEKQYRYIKQKDYDDTPEGLNKSMDDLVDFALTDINKFKNLMDEDVFQGVIDRRSKEISYEAMGLEDMISDFNSSYNTYKSNLETRNNLVSTYNDQLNQYKKLGKKDINKENELKSLYQKIQDLDSTYNLEENLLKLQKQESNIKETKSLIDNESKKIDKLSGTLAKALPLQQADREKQGSFFGFVTSKFIEGFTSTAQAGADIAIDVLPYMLGSVFGPEGLMPEDQYNELKNEGLSDYQIYDKVSKDLKKIVTKDINKIGEAFTDTTQEYTKSEDRGTFENVLGSVVQSIGAATSAPKGIGFFAQSYADMEEEMLDPAFDGLTEMEKKLISVPYAFAIGALDRFGFRTLSGADKSIANRLIINVIGRSMAKLPKSASLEAIKHEINKDLSSMLVTGALDIALGSGVEGVIEGTQSITETGLKNLVNQINEKELFQNVPDISTYEGLVSAVSQAGEETYLGALGGLMFSTVTNSYNIVKERKFNKKSDELFDQYYNLMKDKKSLDSIATVIKLKVEQGEITQEEGLQSLESIKKCNETINKIPDNLSVADKRRSFDLLLERQGLEEDIAGKDEALVAGQNQRIEQINNDLKIISENATKKSTEQQQEGTADGSVVQREGTDQGQPQAGQGEGPVGETTQQETNISDSTVTGGGIQETEVASEVQPIEEEVVIDKPTIATNTTQELERVKVAAPEAEDGSTFNLDGTVYDGVGLVVPVVSVNTTVEEATPEMIADFVEQNADKIGDNETVKVGIYKFPNSNEMSIDLSVVAPETSRDKAIEFGKLADQESLFDLGTFTNVKTGGTGKNPMQFTGDQFKEIAKALKEGRLPNVFEQTTAHSQSSTGTVISGTDVEIDTQASKISKPRMTKIVSNAAKSLSKILPDVKFVVHDTKESFANVTGDTEAAGYYIPGEVHINLENANDRTVAHEVFHAVLLNAVKTDANAATTTRKMIEAIEPKIENNPELKKYLNDFASNYDENIQDEEKVSELVGVLAENYERSPETIKEKIKRWLDNIAKMFGLNPFNKNEVYDVLNTIARKVASGIEITNADVKIIEDVNNGTLFENEYVHTNGTVVSTPSARKSKFKNTVIKESDVISTKEVEGKPLEVVYYDNFTSSPYQLKNRVSGSVIERQGEGGPGYSYREEVKAAGIVAAFTNVTKGLNLIQGVRSRNKVANEPAVVGVALQNKETGHLGNLTTARDFYSPTEGVIAQAVNDGLITEADAVTMLKGAVKAYESTKKGQSKESSLGFKVEDFNTLEDFYNKINSISFERRGTFNDTVIPSKADLKITKATRPYVSTWIDAGIPTLNEYYEATTEQYTKEAQAHDIVKYLDPNLNKIGISSSIPVSDAEVKRAADMGVEIVQVDDAITHTSYPVVLFGNNIGIPSTFNSVREMAEDWNVPNPFFKAGRRKDTAEPVRVPELKETGRKPSPRKQKVLKDKGLSDKSIKTIESNYEDKFGFNDFDWNKESERDNFKEWLYNFEDRQFNKNLDKVTKLVKEDIDLLNERKLIEEKLKAFEELIIPSLGSDVLTKQLSLYEQMVIMDPNATIESIQKGFKEAKNILDKEGNLDKLKITDSTLFKGGEISLPAFEKFIEKNPEYKNVFNDWKKIFDRDIELTLKDTNAFSYPSLQSLNNLYDELTKIKNQQKITPRQQKVSQQVPGNRLFSEPLKQATTIANRYAQNNGIEMQEIIPVKSLDETVSKEIAKEYDKMKNDPTNPEVAKAYKAMAEETLAQYEEIIKDGFFVEINNEEPYANSSSMIEDLRKNKRMKIFSTESGFGDTPITDQQRKENPLLKDSGFKDVNGNTLLVNDVFRFVHDFFGHAKEGNSFGPIGEENAWLIHSAMYSPLARRAMTSETRGQNSWVNFSGVNEEAFKLRDKARKLRAEGKVKEANQLTEEVYNMMQFADQKIGLMPEWTAETPAVVRKQKTIKGNAALDIIQKNKKYIEDRTKRTTLKDVWRGYRQKFEDRQADIKRAISGIDSVYSRRAYDLLVNKAGASGWADERFKEADKKIYKGLNNANLDNLNAIIYAKRIIAINENRAKLRGKAYAGLNKELSKYLDDIIKLKKSKDIEQLSEEDTTDRKELNKIKKAVGEETYNDLVKRSNMYKEPYTGMDDFSTLKAEESLKNFRSELGDKKFEDLENRAKEYFNVFNENLKLSYESGRINKETYEMLRDIDYSPIKTLKYIIGDEAKTTDEIDRLSSIIGMTSDEINKLGEKNENEFVSDTRYLLMAALNASSKKGFENKLLNAVFDAFENANESESLALMEEILVLNPVVGQRKDGSLIHKYDKQDKPEGYKEVVFYKNGVKRKMIIKEKYADQLLDLIKVGKGWKNFGTLTGSDILRFFATSGNPLFILGNVPADFANILFLSDVYGKFKLTGGIHLAFDFVKNFLRSTTGVKFKQIKREYLEHGGSMNYMAADGIRNLQSRTFKYKILKYPQKAMVAYGKTMSFLGEKSEEAFRIAVYEKTKKDLIKKWQEEHLTKDMPTDQDLEDIMNAAVREAREVIDFNQGGEWAKNADAIAPYFNAGFQGLRRMREYAAKKPASFAISMVQAAAMAGGIAAYSLSALMKSACEDAEDEDDCNKKMMDALNSLSEYEKANYHIIFTGKKDDKGEYTYIRIKKLPGLSVITTYAEQLFTKFYLGMRGVDYDANNEVMLKTILSSVPFEPSGAVGRNPLGSAVVAYLGWDLFKWEETFKTPRGWEDREIKSEVEGINDDNVNSLFKFLAPKMYMSPARTQAMVEKIITSESTNPTISILYAVSNGLFSGFTDLSESFSKATDELLKNTSKKLVRTTNKKLLEYAEQDKIRDMEIEENSNEYVNTTKMYDEIKDIYDKGGSLTNGQLLDMVIEKFGEAEAKTYFNKYNNYIRNRNLDKRLLNIVFERKPRLQALYLYERYGNSLEQEELDELNKIMSETNSRVSKEALYFYNDKYSYKK